MSLGTTPAPTGGPISPHAPRPDALARDVVVVAASTGGLAAGSSMLGALPPHFPAAIILVQHRSPDRAHLLPEILQSRVALPVHVARDGERLRAGHLYVAPPDQQALITSYRTIRLTEPHAAAWPLRRGIADPLFASAAAAFHERTFAVVLSGHMADGARGAEAVKQCGGCVLVQDPRTATVADMPSAALTAGPADFALPPRALAHALTALIMAPGARAFFRVESGQVLVPIAPTARAPQSAWRVNPPRLPREHV